MQRTRRAVRALDSVLRRVLQNPSLVGAYWLSTYRIARKSGLTGVVRHALRDRSIEPTSRDYADWVRQFDTITAGDLQAMGERIASFSYRPRISIATPVFNTPETVLRRCIDSVLAQAYPKWELCVADDASSERHVASICEEYAKREPRIKYVRREARGHIAAATNSAIGLASGEYLALLDHDDELAPHALYMVAEALNTNRNLDLLYSDEDKIDQQGNRYEPWFKSDWNYDLMLSQNAVVHLAVFRLSLLREIGGLRSGFEGSQDYDLLLRFSERTKPERIKHVPFVLYHWRAMPGSVALDAAEKLYAYDNAARSIQEHLDRLGGGGVVHRTPHDGYYRVTWPIPAEPPWVSLIIPTKDKLSLLRTAVDSIRRHTTYKNFRVVIVDNGSELDETKSYLAEVASLENAAVLSYEAPFSFASLNNWAVRQVDTPLVAFVNNDIEVISPDWLTEMVGHALRPGVGAVGAKLCYPDGTIQHAGIVVGLGGLAGHPHARFPHDAAGYFGRAACTQRFSAVSAGCMVMKRSLFLEIGGFDEEQFAVAFNDVDIGLRLCRAGYAVVWTPYAELVHHESATLGLPSGTARRALFDRESANLRRRWAKEVENDPFYNPNLTILGGDFSLAFPPRVVKPWRSQTAPG